MAFAAGTIWHNWSSGSTSNGGGFDPTCSGMLSNLTTDSNTANTSAPVVSSSSYTFTGNDVLAWLFIQSGTNWIPGWYQIASVAGGKATLTAGVGLAVLYGTVSTANNYQRPNGLNTTAGCATVGTPTGGVFAIDYSQQTSGISSTDYVIDASTNTDATSTAKPFNKAMLGNIFNFTSGTGFTVQRAQLVSIPSGSIGRFDKSLGTTSSTGGNATMGGAIGSSSAITALTVPMVAGNKIFLKGTFTLTTTTTVTAGASGSAAGGRISVEGFTTYPGEKDGRPVITTATNSTPLITVNANNNWEWFHLKFTNTAATRSTSIYPATAQSALHRIVDCVFDGLSQAVLTYGTSSFSITTYERCEIKNSTSAGVGALTYAHGIYSCYIHDNAGDGINISYAPVFLVNNIIVNNGRYGIYDSTPAGTNVGAVVVARNTIANNVNSGFRSDADIATSMSMYFANNLFYNNGASSVGYNINYPNVSSTELSMLSTVSMFNAFYNGTGLGNVNNFITSLGNVILTGNPFTNTATGDWSLNNTAGAGAACRGIPFTFPGGTVTGYSDIGAVQHADLIAGPINQITGARSIGTY